MGAPAAITLHGLPLPSAPTPKHRQELFGSLFCAVLCPSKKRIGPSLLALCAGPRQEFPIAEDRMPTQLLTYVRLARIQDPAQLAKASQEPPPALAPASLPPCLLALFTRGQGCSAGPCAAAAALCPIILASLCPQHLWGGRAAPHPVLRGLCVEPWKGLSEHTCRTDWLGPERAQAAHAPSRAHVPCNHAP